MYAVCGANKIGIVDHGSGSCAVLARVGDSRLPQGGATRPRSECSDFPACAKRIPTAIAAGTIALRAAARNPIAIPGHACLLRRSSHLETRQTAGSASLS